MRFREKKQINYEAHIKTKSLLFKIEQGYDRRYAIDATKIENELGWKADENFETGILKTIEWYMKHF